MLQQTDDGVDPFQLNKPVALVLAATFEDVSQCLAALVRRLSASGVPQSAGQTATLVLAEILNNVVEHAYRDRTDGRIHLDLCLAEDMLNVEVRDTGHPILGDLPGGSAAVTLDQPIDDLPEGGFGWGLIHLLTRSLSYHSTGETNRLRCEIPLEDESE